MRNIVRKPQWLVEMVAVWGYVRLVYITANAMAITFIGAGVEGVSGTKIDTAHLMTFLMVGALIWSYLSVLFDVLSETVSWERWEGTIEYTFMSPASRVTHLLGMGVYAVVYGIAQIAIMFGVVTLFFELDLSEANYWGALLVLAVCSVSLVGFGIVAAVLP
ncbi:MAG: ABC transporter permease, partial [Actinobacteria bacterium]|nr:ABC transporter permease [Actinomycetota bacterium]